MTVLRNLIVLLQLQTAFGASVQARDYLLLRCPSAGRWLIGSGRFNDAVVDVFRLLPQSIPEVLIGLCFGHCFGSLVYYCRRCSSSNRPSWWYRRFAYRCPVPRLIPPTAAHRCVSSLVMPTLRPAPYGGSAEGGWQPFIGL